MASFAHFIYYCEPVVDAKLYDYGMETFRMKWCLIFLDVPRSEGCLYDLVTVV